MRILVLGAGGIGGYFGGRLVEKGENVVFLVRDKRKQQLESNGLVIQSTKGDFSFHPQLITKDQETEPFDVVLFSTKAYHLSEAIDDLQPFVGDETVIIPLLNGISHLEQLTDAFGVEKVMGGLCQIETTLNEAGEVVHSSQFDKLVFGELNEQKSNRMNRIAKAFSRTKADFILSEHILQDMWHKYLRITVLSGLTTLMRVPIGPIRESDGGMTYIKQLYEEVTAIMRANHAPIAPDVEIEQLASIETLGYDFKTSMQRDMEKGSQIEGDHIQGYLLSLAKNAQINAPYLTSIFQNLKVFEQTLS
ncbi:2-dehydropantoate 2-reductase [Amphibacillus indicireducens]|uniref:2-dehydropantoate 2-reductase n=1 Tax=Amphibacillus indicireducens TaxID=1076330 RepID=A0ABP7W442_9BACI